MASQFDTLFAGGQKQPAAPAVPTTGGSQFDPLFNAPDQAATSQAQSMGVDVGYAPSEAPYIVQGLGAAARDVAISGAKIGEAIGPYMPTFVPGEVPISQSARAVDEALSARQRQYQASVYGQSYPSQITRGIGDIALTAPLTPVGGPEALAGGIAERALAGLPGVSARAAAIGGNLAGKMTGSGLASGFTNMLSAGGYGPDEGSPNYPAYTPSGAFTTGAAGGAIVGAGGAMIGRGANPALSAAADRIDFPLTRGDIEGGAWRRLEDATEEMPGSGAGAMAQRKMASIATTIGNEMGIPGPLQNIDPDMWANAGQNISNGFKAVLPRLSADVDAVNPTSGVSLRDALANLVNAHENSVPGAVQSPAYWKARDLQNRVLNLVGFTPHGTMTGPELQDFIKTNGALDMARNAKDADVKGVGDQVYNALLDAAEATPATSTADMQRFQQLRGQWKAHQQFGPLINQSTQGLADVANPSITIRNIIKNPKTGWDMTWRDPATGLPSKMTDLAQVLNDTKPLKYSTQRGLIFQKMFGLGSEAGGLMAPAAAYLSGNPEAAGWAFTHGTLPVAGFAAAGRYSRLGPGLGLPGVNWVANRLNPLPARTVGPWIGNQLSAAMQSGAPQQ